VTVSFYRHGRRHSSAIGLDEDAHVRKLAYDCRHREMFQAEHQLADDTDIRLSTANFVVAVAAAGRVLTASGHSRPRRWAEIHRVLLRRRRRSSTTDRLSPGQLPCH